MKLAKDKKQHAAGGFLLGLLIPGAWGIVAWYTAAVGKEFYDGRSGKGTEDIEDVYVTCLGGIVGSILNALILWLVL